MKRIFQHIQIHPEDAYYQLLYWRKDLKQPVKFYKVRFLCSVPLQLLIWQIEHWRTSPLMKIVHMHSQPKWYSYSGEFNDLVMDWWHKSSAKVRSGESNWRLYRRKTSRIFTRFFVWWYIKWVRNEGWLWSRPRPRETTWWTASIRTK